MRVLLIEDNERLSALLSEGLEERAFVVDQAPDLQRAAERLAASPYEAVILDLGLPDGDGLVWLRAAQQAGRMPPVLILTARGSLGDRIAGLDSGADDYVMKPFEIDEVAARVRALLRRPGKRLAPELKVGALKFDASTRTASFGGARLDLTRRESDLLEVLMRRAGRVTSKASIENAVYRLDSEISGNAVQATMSRLKRKLATVGAGDLIVTRRGDGYKIEAPARQPPNGRAGHAGDTQGRA